MINIPLVYACIIIVRITGIGERERRISDQHGVHAHTSHE